MTSVARILAAFTLLFVLSPSQAQSHEVVVGNLTFTHPFARASAGPGRAGVTFMGIKNNGDQADRLVAASVSTDIAGKAGIHTHIMENDVAKMRKIEGGIEIPAGGMVMLEPGGLHVMLMKLTGPLEEGEDFMLTLVFEKAGEVTLHIPILGVDAGSSSEMDHGEMSHDDMSEQ